MRPGSTPGTRNWTPSPQPCRTYSSNSPNSVSTPVEGERPMTARPEVAPPATALVPHGQLHALVSGLLSERGVPAERAELAAAALCHGDLCGFESHGVFNLTRLYLPLFDSHRVDARAEPTTLTDLGACAVVDACR